MEVATSIVILFFWFASIIFPFIISGNNYRCDDEETQITRARKNSHFLKG